MGLQEVSNILWRERYLLELLLYKLEVEQLVLSAGKSRWLTASTREAEAVLEQLRAVELARAVEVNGLARELRLPENPSLREVAAAVPEPWGQIFDDHRRTFLELAEEISAITATNRELLARGQAATREAMAWLHDAADVDLYSPSGTGGRAPVVHLLDEVV